MNPIARKYMNQFARGVEEAPPLKQNTHKWELFCGGVIQNKSVFLPSTIFYIKVTSLILFCPIIIWYVPPHPPHWCYLPMTSYWKYTLAPSDMKLPFNSFEYILIPSLKLWPGKTFYSPSRRVSLNLYFFQKSSDIT